VFVGMTGYFMASAEKYVADRERIRHWDEEPTLRRRRRRVPRPAGVEAGESSRSDS
jgi:hypothetical protein